MGAWGLNKDSSKRAGEEDRGPGGGGGGGGGMSSKQWHAAACSTKTVRHLMVGSAMQAKTFHLKADCSS